MLVYIQLHDLSESDFDQTIQVMHVQMRPEPFHVSRTPARFLSPLKISLHLHGLASPP